MPMFPVYDDKNIFRILAALMRIPCFLTNIGTKLAYTYMDSTLLMIVKEVN